MQTPARIVKDINQPTRRAAAGLFDHTHKLDDTSTVSYGETLDIIEQSIPANTPLAELNHPKQALRGLKITLGAIGKDGTSVDFEKCETSLQNGYKLIKAYADQLEADSAGVHIAGDARSEWGLVTTEGESHKLNLRGSTASKWKNTVMDANKATDVLMTARGMLTTIERITHALDMTVEPFDYARTVE